MECLRVVDNFLPDFWSARNFALGQKFGEESYRGASYDGIAPDWGRFPTEHLENVVGFPIQPTMSYFRLNLLSEKESTGPFIHVDHEVEGSKWAALIYLTSPELDIKNYGGTAFWRHKEFGISGLPTSLEVVKSYTDPIDFIEDINKDGFDESKWELEGLIRMKSNRLLVYPGDIFHSRWPKQGFGTEAKDGRLVWVCFFREADNGSVG